MASEWRTVRLGDLVGIRHGWPFKSELYSTARLGRPIVVSIGNFQYTGGFRFESTTIKEYSAEYPREYDLKAGDLLVVMTCQTAGGEILGIPARIPNDGHVYLHNQRLGLVVPKSGDVDLEYLYWLFLSRDFNRHLVATASGTKILHTAPSRIEAFEFRLPPRRVQSAIAHILGTLDDKIDLNRRMNETLETMARALFKSWFVDFDPVRAKAESRTPTGMDAETANLFPGEFLTSRLGPIPKGWQVASVGDLVDLQRGTTYKSALKGIPGPVLLGLGAIERNGGFRDDKLATYGGPSPEKLLLGPGDMFVSLKDVTQSADLLGAVARVPAHVPRGRLTQDTVKLVFKTADPIQDVLYQTLLSSEYREYCRGHATGTTNLGLSRDDFFAFPVVVAPPPVLFHFNTIVSALERQAQVRVAESRTLSALRDELLPRLLSGEISVAHAERAVGAAT